MKCIDGTHVYAATGDEVNIVKEVMAGVKDCFVEEGCDLKVSPGPIFKYMIYCCFGGYKTSRLLDLHQSLKTPNIFQF